MSIEANYDETTRDVYERASFGGSVPLGSRPAVLVVDFSLAFTDPEFALGADMTDAVEACRRVLDAARAKGALIMYTTVAYTPGLKDAGLTIQKSPACGELQYGSRWAEIDPRLGVRPEELVIVKKAPSALFGTNVGAIMTGEGIDTVILCGAVTSGCIRATAIDLFQHNFPTLVPRDAVADRAPGPHEANLFDIGQKYAEVATSERAVEYLESVPSALTPAA